MYSLELSDILRTSVQPLCKFRDEYGGTQILSDRLGHPMGRQGASSESVQRERLSERTGASRMRQSDLHVYTKVEKVIRRGCLAVEKRSVCESRKQQGAVLL